MTEVKDHTDGSRLRIPTAIILLLFGAISVIVALISLGKWPEMVRNTRIYYADLFAGGVVLLVCGLLASLSPKWLRMTLIFGGVASLVLSLNQFTGLRLQSIICYTPG